MLGGWLGRKEEKKQATVQNQYNAQAATDQYNYDVKRMNLQDALNREAEQRQYDRGRVQEKERFSWLVKGAQNAGFNPLTVLGGTGGAMGNPIASMAAPAAGQTANTKIAPLSNVGNTIASAGEQFAAYLPDPIAQQTQRLSNQLLAKQIAQIDRENLRFGQPVTKSTQSNARVSGNTWPVTTQFGPIAQSAIGEETQEQRAREEGSKNMYSGFKWPGFLPTGQTVEDWGGDLAGNAYSVGAVPLALSYNLREKVGQYVQPWKFSSNPKNPRNPSTVLKENYRRDGGRIQTYPLGGF